ncbi:SPOR domain-containing protein [Paramixta manurensis]|uniref:Cell division protein DamX n=1 Tax=Paramixta manurensis TaxID=2740817 RepID=A0A6M8U9X6_9GAMM|nr:SPOR domain-containing protein [Erwiniaceae bacterium PD-1]
MDEFKPEDELKPDASDRRPTRSRKTSSAPKVPVSRQHMMMGIGILVLLLLVIGIGSALKGPSDSSSSQPTAGNNAASGNNAANGNAPANANGGEKNIDLSGSSSMSGQTPASPSGGENASGTAAQNTPPPSPQELSAPPVSNTPTQAAPVQAPQNQQRVELPGDLNSALNNQQGQVDAATQGAANSSSLPTAPATVSGTAGNTNPQPVNKPAPHHTASHNTKPAATHKPTANKPAAQAQRPTASAHNASSGHSSVSAANSAAPGGSYTLQLSSASRQDTLNAWAKKQNLSAYHVYQTTRNGQPWYVLVSGSYATPAEAKRAVASLPAEVRAQNPWVKPVSQVKKEAGK